METVMINGVEYVPASQVIPVETMDGMEYKIVRTFSAGVFAGYIEKREGKEVTMRNARRIWYWDGAASLSQLAMEGTCKPENCKFAIPVDRVVVTEAIEILDVTQRAKDSIDGVALWRAEA
jgi:hypothetical protein